MQTTQRFANWFSKQGIVGKVTVGCSSLFVLCCLCSVPIAILSPSTPIPEVTNVAITETASSHTPVQTETPTGISTATLTPPLIPTDTSTPTHTPMRTATSMATITPRPINIPSGNCNSSYPDVCLQDGIGDYDCAGGSGNGPNYIEGPLRVLPPDPFDLDRDKDGIGCE